MELLTRAQAAERLGISLSTLDAERLAGNLEYIQHKRYGKVMISEDAIRAYITRGTHNAKPVRPVVINTYRKRRK